MQSIINGKKTNNAELSFLEVFKTTVMKDPLKEAIIYEDTDGVKMSVSFKSMDEISNRIANVLKQISRYHKLEGNIIAVALNPSENLPIILLAILKAGMAYLPIDITFPTDRIKYILDDCVPIISIIEDSADSSIYQSSMTLTKKQLVSDSELVPAVITHDVKVPDVAVILYTSGSTGTPKGVKLSYTALMNRLSWQWRELPYSSNENNCIFKTAITFVDSVCEIWAPLLQGRTLVVIPRSITRDPEKFIILLNKYKIQRIVLVPTLLKSILMYLKLQKERTLEILKIWICSGETLPVYLVKEFFSWFARKDKILANFYGSTEIMGDVTFYVIEENDLYLKQNKIPIGKPIDNCIIYIVDESLNLLDQGKVGELLVAGKNLSLGYIHDNDTQKFINNPFSYKNGYTKIFRTGDYAKIEDGLIFYEGRKDNQIKIRGHRIDISEVQKAVLNLPIVEDATVLSYNYDNSEQILLCFIVLKEKETNFKPKEIQLLLSHYLVPYMIPKIIIVNDIPLLINGKTDRQKLLESYELSEKKNKNNQTEFNFSNVPEDQITKANILFSTIVSVINLNDKSLININSNFYELGGNSLNSVYTVSKLREQGYFIGITDFITATSVKEILLKMKKSSKVMDDTINSAQYKLEILNDTHKNIVIEMITESFFSKADLEKWLIPEIRKQDYCELMQQLWNPLVEKCLSFILKSSADDILSVALNFDARDEPDVTIKSKLNIIFDFLEFLEKPIREGKLPKGKNKIFHTFMMATKSDLKPADNVSLIRIMELKCIEIAKNNNFAGIFTTNTSPLTQQLGTDVFHYEVMLDYQVNQYIARDGSKPFIEAPDEQRAIVSWKKIHYENKSE